MASLMQNTANVLAPSTDPHGLKPQWMRCDMPQWHDMCHWVETGVAESSYSFKTQEKQGHQDPFFWPQAPSLSGLLDMNRQFGAGFHITTLSGFSSTDHCALWYSQLALRAWANSISTNTMQAIQYDSMFNKELWRGLLMPLSSEFFIAIEATLTSVQRLTVPCWRTLRNKKT